jgi:hypothetical protein
MPTFVTSTYLLCDTTQGPREYSSSGEVNIADYWSMYLVNDAAANEFYRKSDLRGLPEGHADVPTLFMASNRGRVFQLFDNTHHNKVCIYSYAFPVNSLSSANSQSRPLFY